jgi:hypothetical protein
VWRCHLVDYLSGIATDVVSAEVHLRRALQMSGVLPSRTYARRELSRAA